MKLIKTENQKLYLSKFCQDMSKAVLIIMVIAPLVDDNSYSLFTYFSGGWVSFIFFITGYMLESREVQ